MDAQSVVLTSMKLTFTPVRCERRVKGNRGRGRHTLVCFDLIKLVRGVVADKHKVEVIIWGTCGQSNKDKDRDEISQAAGCIARA